MADELEELDPDLIFDLPGQQASGLFHQGIDDSLDFQHNELSLSFSELGAGFGNIREDGCSDLGVTISPNHNAPFSLADELADAFITNGQPASSALLDELELEQGDHGLFSSIQSSPLRTAKSSRMTTASRHVEVEDDKDATNSGFEEETAELQESVRNVEQFCRVLHDYNNTAAHTSVESEARVETLASNLIRKTYEHVKQCEDGMKDLQAIQADLKLEAIWIAPYASASNEDGESLQPYDSNASGLHHDGEPTFSDKSTSESGATGDLKQSILQAMAEFRISTEELSSSLATISELLQVNRAAASDSWRKVRGAETGMSRLRSEIESAEISQERIARWEENVLPRQSAIPGLSTPPQKTPTQDSKVPVSASANLGSQAHKHLLAVQYLLDNATVPSTQTPYGPVIVRTVRP